RTEEETPITLPGVKIPLLTQEGPSNVKGASMGFDGRESTETSPSLGRQAGEVTNQGVRLPPQVEEQTLTMTRSELQKMIAEAVTIQLKQTHVEQPRVEQLRVEQPRVEQPQIEQPHVEREQQAQSNERH
ncbi:Unknown protein, partial [Striga hermonthica]